MVNPYEYDDPYGQNPYAQYANGDMPLPLEDPAPGGMPGTPANPNTGVGGAPDPAVTPAAVPTAAATPIAFSDAAFQAILRKYPPTPEGRQQALAEANRTFGTSLTWMGSKGDKIKLPDGRIIDVVIGSGTSNPQWGWQDTSTSSGSGFSGDLSSIAIDPSFLQPWTGSAPNPHTPDFQGPGDFVAPTAQDVFADPSYQFRMDQGRGMLENSAAAKGVLNSGGTLSDILNYGQKAASQEYSNVWDRAFGLWNAKWNNALTGFRANSDSNNSAYQRAWNQYTDARDSFYRNQNEPFGKLIQVAQIGAGAAR